MPTMTAALLVLLLPLAGTVLGSSFVMFMRRDEMNPLVQKALLGFASGVMLAASVWSLIMPGIEMAEEQGVTPWVPAAVGFLLGMGFLLALDSLIPHLHMHDDEPEGCPSCLGRSTMLVLAVALHNLPEGMAVGVVLAGALSGNAGISLTAAVILSVGIAMQNLPEGAVISMPLKSNGMSRGRAFSYGALSGVVEPIGALLTVLLTSVIVPVLPYILSFAAGAMVYVVVEELVPEFHAGEHSNIGTIGTALGFTLMMILDVALG